MLPGAAVDAVLYCTVLMRMRSWPLGLRYGGQHGQAPRVEAVKRHESEEKKVSEKAIVQETSRLLCEESIYSLYVNYARFCYKRHREQRIFTV